MFTLNAKNSTEGVTKYDAGLLVARLDLSRALIRTNAAKAALDVMDQTPIMDSKGAARSFGSAETAGGTI